MAFWEDDADVFLEDFSITVKLRMTGYPSKDISVLFDNADEVYNIQSGEMISSPTQIKCLSTDVQNVQMRDIIEYNKIIFYVIGILDDKTGFTILQLSES